MVKGKKDVRVIQVFRHSISLDLYRLYKPLDLGPIFGKFSEQKRCVHIGRWLENLSVQSAWFKPH